MFVSGLRSYAVVQTPPVPVAAGPHVLKVVCNAGASDGLPQLRYVEIRPAKGAPPAGK